MVNFRLIDMQTYKRKAHFEYFNKMAYPYVGVTVNVDITSFLGKIKKLNQPFFLSFLYEIANSANEINEFRQRILDGNIIEYESCNTAHTVMKADGTYSYCVLDCNKSFDEYLKYALAKHEKAKNCGSIEEDDENISYFYISSLPWLSYTSFIQPVPTVADTNPRITWGKYFEQNNKILIPVSVLVNHSLVDGLHISAFYDNLSFRLQKY